MKRFELIFIILVVLLYSLAAFTRNLVWEDDLTLWSDVIRKSPGKARGYNNIGVFYAEKKCPGRQFPL